ncbi:COMM domain-containing protein 7-like [Narcine bancroftii]|uniref:COMM domain-containing protein 7-like n=1 Tax=Narcine bancroftii TaxID=1343680 RepID=UPI003831DE54
MHKLHFSGETVSDALSSDIQALNKLSNQQFSALTEIIFHFVTEPTESVRLLNELSEFASKNGMSSGPLKNILKNVLLVPYGALKRNLTADHIKADFITLGLGEEKAGCFADQWKLHSTVLSRLALEQTMTVNQLVDMEWKFGVTAGSSELQKVGSIFLQLKLVIKKGNKTEIIYMELTLPQFYNFLHEMEQAKTSLECFG